MTTGPRHLDDRTAEIRLPVVLPRHAASERHLRPARRGRVWRGLRLVWFAAAAWSRHRFGGAS